MKVTITKTDNRKAKLRVGPKGNPWIAIKICKHLRPESEQHILGRLFKVAANVVNMQLHRKIMEGAVDRTGITMKGVRYTKKKPIRFRWEDIDKQA